MASSQTLRYLRQTLRSFPSSGTSPRNGWICASCMPALKAKRSRRKASSSALRGQAIPQSFSDAEAAQHAILHEAKAPAVRESDSHPPDRQRRSEPLNKSSMGTQATTMEYLQRLIRPSDGRSIKQPRNFPSSSPAQLNALEDALERQDYYPLLILLNKMSDRDVRNLPATTWSKIIDSLNPRLHSPPLHKHHRSFNAQRLRQIGISYPRLSDEFMAKVVELVRVRREVGLDTSAVDHSIILQHAARRGDGSLASALWAEMTTAGIARDLVAYNAYMEAVVWDEGARLAFEHKNVTQHEVGMFAEGASKNVRAIFEEMRQEYIRPDTRSYCAYITALARDGYLDEVEDLLSRTFGIDVDAILGGTSSSEPESMAIAALRPTHRLLVTLASIYGQANRIPTAVSVIDWVRTTFNIPVTKGVWYQLIRWTWIQARILPKDRSVKSRRETTQLAIKHTLKLGKMMIDKPYAVSPPLSIRDFLFRSSYTVGDFRQTIGIMLEQAELGRLEYVKLIAQARRHDYVRSQRRKLKHPSARGVHARTQATDQFVANLNLKRKLTFLTLHRWARKIVSLPNSPRLRHKLPHAELLGWQQRGMPNFILHWSNFLPHEVKYKLPTGTVQLLLRSEEEQSRQKLRQKVTKTRRKFIWLNKTALKQPWSIDALKSWEKRRLRRNPSTIGVYDILPKKSPHRSTGRMFDRSYE